MSKKIINDQFGTIPRPTERSMTIFLPFEMVLKEVNRATHRCLFRIFRQVDSELLCYRSHLLELDSLRQSLYMSRDSLQHLVRGKGGASIVAGVFDMGNHSEKVDKAFPETVIPSDNILDNVGPDRSLIRLRYLFEDVRGDVVA